MRFGPFEVNLRTGELRKRGIRIALLEQPFRILSALLDASGDIVTRQELCRRLWPDGTFVDFEHSLNAAVRRLRVALGDEADIARFVETVPRVHCLGDRRRRRRWGGCAHVCRRTYGRIDHASGARVSATDRGDRANVGHAAVWAATYDRTLNGALTVQMEVAEAIATAVVQSLTHLRDAVGF